MNNSFVRFVVLGIFVAYANASLEDLLPYGASKFSYAASKGPSSWAETFDACADLSQSPIALDECEWSEDLPALKFNGHWEERADGFILQNTGHAALVQWTGEAPTLSGGPLQGEYTLAQAHFHWGEELEGSEHEMHGEFFGMELHFVHYKTEYGSVSNGLNYPDGLAVVGVMFKAEEEESRSLEAIVGGLAAIEEAGDTTVLASDAMEWTRKLMEAPGSYYTYSGSLTTPPCSEVVTWINLRKTSEIGVAQIEEFRTLTGHEGPILENVRPLQALNGRTVRCSV